MSMSDLAQLNMKVRPIHQWPGGCTKPDERCSPFKAGLTDTAKLLARELRALSAKEPILELALREQDIRNDGLPRADARVSHPGVIVTFSCKYGQIRPYADACRTWQDNLRAIAMHLEHLRLASLYGVGKAGQQYTGWKALPQNPPAAQEMTLALAAATLEALCGHAYVARDILAHHAAAAGAYRAAAMKTHPDQNGGLDADFKLATAARDVLAKHHGVA